MIQNDGEAFIEWRLAFARCQNEKVSVCLGTRAILPGDAGDLVANAKRCGYIAFNYDNDGHNFGMRQRHVGWR